MPRLSLPTRKLADRPDLDQLKRQAKELLEAFREGASEAVAEITALASRETGRRRSA